MGVVHWYFIRDFQNLPHPRPTHTPPSLLIIKLCYDAFTNQQDKDYFIMPCYMVSNILRHLQPPPKDCFRGATICGRYLGSRNVYQNTRIQQSTTGYSKNILGLGPFQ